MANTIVTEILAKDKTRAGLKSADKGITGFAKRMGGLFKGLLGPVAALAGAAGLGLLAKKLFELGSSAVETRSRFESVFADQTTRVDDFIESFGKIAGVSKVNLQALTATSAAIAQGLGFAGDAAATLSIDITRLAGDLGSFNDIPTAETARAIQSALTGERESLKRLGIVIKQVQVDQLALVQTGKASIKELTEQDRATATLALITEKAGVAVGDLARTQTSAANQARQIKAEFQNIADTIALGLLPAFEKLLPVLKDLASTIADALPGIATFFVTLRDAIAGDEISDDVRATEESIRRLGFTAEQITAQRTRTLDELVRKQDELNKLETHQASLNFFQKLNSESDARILKIRALTIEVAELSAVEETLLRLADERAAAEEVADTAATTRVRNAKAEALEKAQGGFGVTPGVIAGPGGAATELRGLGEIPEQREMITAVDDFSQGVFDALEPLREFNEELDKMENLGRLVGEVMVGMSNQFVRTFSEIGRGGNVFAAFAKGSKKAIGDVASAEGQKGIALGALKIGESLFPPNPVMLASGLLGIAKGGLLVALGAKLGAGGRGIGGGGRGGGGGGIPRRDNTIDGNRRGHGGPRGRFTVQLPPGNILDLNNPELFAAFTKAQKDANERGVQLEFERN